MNWRIPYTIILVIAWIAIGYLYIDYSLDSPNRSEEIYITIPEKSSVKKVGEILVQNKIINKDWFFAYYIKLKGISIKAGDYSIKPNETLDDVLKKLVEGKDEGVKVTIAEGSNVMDIANKLKEKGLDSEGFLKALENRQPKYAFEKQISDDSRRYFRLEGYLFPTTYFFHPKEKPEKIVDEMLKQFDMKIKKYEGSIKGKSIHGQPLTLEQVVTIASLVEREAKRKEEFKKISGVIYNRLNKPNDPNFKKLQLDASRNFAQKMESQFRKGLARYYDTYIQTGLPPGPIASPGERALEAAVNPEVHQYYYYVVKGDGSGFHFFSSTFAEHRRYIQMSNQNQKKRASSS
ncbi:endolytic transglycosylase MltG [Thermoflavimicrobium dichotomicum]|uniref:Endolytic murein transglycosylase n=1 Tax=Thermoflavimicrobium dichotomicum TaxID=46223 RepID=A0A1I3MXU6_9BACL|nr:endolytic transglycosylase MltG [Thermoflavimicrobium dichotomicum]SFJ01575.1 UPF0755 protein [Thermoflavimicrobium dichotomicum]